DETSRAEGECGSWCTTHLFFVPAQAAGTWRLPQGELKLEQKFQVLSGTLSTSGRMSPITNGRLRGDEISFSAGGVDYAGRVNGDTMSGNVKGAAGGAWTATRARQ